MPALTLEALAEAAGATGLVGSADLPGAAPGEHPFFYALEAVRHLCGLRVATDLARINPTIFFKAKNRSSTHTALISRLLLDAKDHSMRDHLRKHLAS